MLIEGLLHFCFCGFVPHFSECSTNLQQGVQARVKNLLKEWRDIMAINRAPESKMDRGIDKHKSFDFTYVLIDHQSHFDK